MTVSWRNYRLWILVLVVVALTRSITFFANLNNHLTVNATSQTLVISSGESLSAVVHRLNTENVLSNSFDLLLYARLTGKANRIRAGEYALDESLTPLSLLQLFIDGDVMYHSITLLEGWTLKQVLEELKSQPGIESTLPYTSYESLQVELGLEEYPEGMFFPDTYYFTRGTTDRELLLQANTLLQSELAAAWENRDVGLPYSSSYEALIMASIVEKETGLASERSQIAGVFIKRLELGMRLQTDPTVIYGLGDDFTGNLTRAHLREPNPYNTYTNNGLPPTPIALAGRAALDASVHPTLGNALYFVAKGDGSHKFSATLQEHNAAVQTYQIDARQTDQNNTLETTP